MAPELALRSLERLSKGVVLDPMTGSGTVARVAKNQALDAVGFDLDPLAVLISKVATTPVCDAELEASAKSFIERAKSISEDEIALDWIDGDQDAEKFINYWFAEEQRSDLRKLSFLLSNDSEGDLSPDIADVLRIALSRIIVTKKAAASLAQDTSHSRPHRVSESSDYDVFSGFEKSVRAVRKRVSTIPLHGSVTIQRGDARDLKAVADGSVDAVLTSPPYLNAIDYMRGHRMALVWLGHRYADLTKTRSNSIGAERKPDIPLSDERHGQMKMAMGDLVTLDPRYHGMIDRYVIDMYQMMSEIARVLKSSCTATFVMGNSCLRGVYIQNSEALAKAGELLGLGVPQKHERDLPSGSRYLPTPASGSLSKRMRKEVILTFQKP
jgi:tRNA G10  N-methylase Trm11